MIPRRKHSFEPLLTQTDETFLSKYAKVSRAHLELGRSENEEYRNRKM